MKSIFDCVVIGAGVAGMTAAIYLKRANLNVLLLEKNAPGGMINRSSRIENYPGFKKIDGPTLAMNIFDQVTNLNITYKYGDVIDIIDKGEYKIIKTDIEEIECKNIIIASGRVPRLLGLENEKSLGGRGVGWCATCDGIFFKEKDVAVVGGGNQALEETLFLSQICKSVTLIHRKNYFTGDAILVDEIKNKKNITILYDTVIDTLIEESDKLSAIIVDNKIEKKKIDVEGLFIFIGHEPDTKFLKNTNVLLENGYVVVDENMKTNVDNIYACGDVIKKELYQLTTAVGEGAMAANQVKKNIKI